MYVTPELAAWLLERTNHEAIQRPVETERVLGWYQRMQAMEFKPSPPITFRREEDGGLVLTNGQHRLMAIALGDSPIDLDVRIDDGDVVG